MANNEWDVVSVQPVASNGSDDEWGIVSETPVKKTGIIEAGKKGLLSGITGLAESVGTGMQWAGERIGSDTLKEVGKTTEKHWNKVGEQYAAPEDLQGSIIDNPRLLTKGSWLVYNVMQSAPSIAASIIPGIGTSKAITIAGKARALSPALIEKLARIGGAVTGGTTGGALGGTYDFGFGGPQCNFCRKNSVSQRQREN